MRAARPRTDSNQTAIVKALRSAGASVQSLASTGAGCPDLLVGHRGSNHLMELKDGTLPPSRRRLTKDQVAWHRCWYGTVQIVSSVEEALAVLGEGWG